MNTIAVRQPWLSCYESDECDHDLSCDVFSFFNCILMFLFLFAKESFYVNKFFINWEIFDSTLAN